ncbi:hypothetical protein I4U23_001371 [Adineta vaga]|nr:hypothetical protein I4U23_001371 [Adineta vaga]
MSDEFRDCFVSEKGYDALKKLMRGGNDLSKDLAKCFQERNEAELAYVRALRKNSDSLQKLAGRTKGSFSQALTTLASQTNKQSDAHSMIGDVLLREISMPMKNLAETQYKDLKLIEDALNAKFKEWNLQKDIDNKYRSRQFDKSREIETLNVKISEASKTGKSSSKDSSKESNLPTTLLKGCVRPSGRSTSHFEKLDTSIKKAEEELEAIERKYHTATKDVEIARQACDEEMCRNCDRLQKMEIDRLTEMANFFRTFDGTMKTVSETIHQISEDIHTIQIIPENDIVTVARSSVQMPETEILLYDIYAENMSNTMSEYRRKLSLMQWIETLKRDIEIQKQTRTEGLSSLSSAPSKKKLKDQSINDGVDLSSDGAMCSTRSKRDAAPVDEEENSSSNDDDGGMHRRKSKKLGKKNIEDEDTFSSERFIDRRSVELVLCLYEASLYKFEYAYNQMIKAPEPYFEYANCITKTFNDKGTPITLVRVPFQPTTQTPPSAPSAMTYFAKSIMPQPMAYASVQKQPPNYGWKAPDSRQESPMPAKVSVAQRESYPEKRIMRNQMVACAPPGPALMTRSVEFVRPNRDKHVRAKFSYKAKREDELDLQKGDIIILLETRQDGWCRGQIEDKFGLFPGNYVEDA